MVFAPTQVINFTLVPLHHRLFVQQAVGLGECRSLALRARRATVWGEWERGGDRDGAR